MEYPLNWEFLIPLILGSSVLASFIAFGLSIIRSRIKETSEHNNNIRLIYNELKTIQNTLQNKDYINDIESDNVRVLLPTGNMDYLTSTIVGNIKSETLNVLQQVHEDVGNMRHIAFRRRLNVNEELHKINCFLEQLKSEIKGGLRKPNLDS